MSFLGFREFGNPQAGAEEVQPINLSSRVLQSQAGRFASCVGLLAHKSKKSGQKISDDELLQGSVVMENGLSSCRGSNH